jgi:hypothetical protein
MSSRPRWLYPGVESRCTGGWVGIGTSLVESGKSLPAGFEARTVARPQLVALPSTYPGSSVVTGGPKFDTKQPETRITGNVATLRI